MTTDDRLETVKYLITKQEQLRTNNTNRASVMIAASTFLTAAYALFGALGGNTTEFSHDTHLSSSVFGISFLVGLFFAVVALICSLRGTVNLFRRSRDYVGRDVPVRLHAHSGDTVGHFKDYASFRQHLLLTADSELADSLIADLWSIHILHCRQYASLRRAGQALVIAAVLLFFQMSAIILIRVF